jgi:hypothetical protein
LPRRRKLNFDCATAARIRASTPASDSVAALFRRTKRFSFPLALKQSVRILRASTREEMRVPTPFAAAAIEKIESDGRAVGE